MSKFFYSFEPVTTPLAQRPTFVAVLSLAALLALGACGKSDDGKTVGQKVDAALAKTEQAAAEAKTKAESAMANAGAVMKDATQKGEAASKGMANKVEGKFDDLTITTAVNAGLAKNTELSALKINVDVKNGVVILKGTASSPAAKERAAEITKAVKGVVEVDNQLIVKSN